jgi:aryl-alcohol dehydrogenase-like predicted oxidoreductase
LWTAERLGLEPIVCLQNQYNLLCRRQLETDLLPVCRRFGLGLMTYSPLAVGLLSGRFRRGESPPPNAFWSQPQLDQTLSERGDQVVQTLIELAHERNVTPAQMAFAWLLDHPDVTAPISGADRPEYVDEIFGSLEIELTQTERERLAQVSQWNETEPYL